MTRERFIELATAEQEPLRRFLLALCGGDRMEAEGVVSPVVSVECVYKHPTTFKDVIEVEVHVAEMSALKITFGYTMRANGRVVCTARSVHCFMENGRPVALETRFPQLFSAIQHLPTS